MLFGEMPTLTRFSKTGITTSFLDLSVRSRLNIKVTCHDQMLENADTSTCFFPYIYDLLQGVVTSQATMMIEVYAAKYRSLTLIVGSFFFSFASMSMSIFAYLLQDKSWRYLQFALSLVSLITVLVQIWYVIQI